MARAPAAQAAPSPASRRETARAARERGTAGAGAAFLPRAPRRLRRPAAKPDVAPRGRAARSERNAQARRVSCSNFQLSAFQRITRGAPGVIGFSAKPANSPVSSLRRARRRKRAFAAAATTAAAVISGLRRQQHRLALGIACLLKLFPPLREFLGRLAACAPQHEKV